MKSPNVRSDDPERMIRALDLELQRTSSRRKPGTRFAFRVYGLGFILLLIVAMLVALQFLTSQLQALSGHERELELQNSGAMLR